MKTLKCPLNQREVNALMAYLDIYAKLLPDKMWVLAERLYREVGIPTIDDRIADAKGDSSKNHTTALVISKTSNGITGTITVYGEDIVFIEFGAGVHYNTAAGDSPHKKGKQLGYTIGSYGQGRGKYDVWLYKGDDGNMHQSQGTEATMPLLNATEDMRAAVVRICKEVLK